MQPKQDESSCKTSDPGTALSTPTTPTERAEQVFRWVVEGRSEHDILEACVAQFQSDGKPMLIAAMRRLAQSSQFDVGVVVGWCVEATRHLYMKMVDIGDYAGALRAVKQMSEMTRHVQHGGTEEESEDEGLGGIREAQGTSESKRGGKNSRRAGHRRGSTAKRRVDTKTEQVS